MTLPTQVTTSPSYRDEVRLVASALPPGQPGGQPGQPTGGEGTDHGVPPALPHPPPVFGALQAPEPDDGLAATIWIEDAGILHTDNGDYVTGTVNGQGRVLRYPTTLTTLSIGLKFYAPEGLALVVSLAPLPFTE